MAIIRKKSLFCLIYALFGCFMFGTSLAAETNAAETNTNTQASNQEDIRLYTLNCGDLNIHDMAGFSDTNFYPHHAFKLADPCFLIKHPKGWLLWDTGVGDQYVGQRVDDKKYDVTITAPLSLVAQLKQLGLTPDDIQYVALSHAHFDHTGNVNLFPKARFLLQQTEYESIQKNPLPVGVKADLFSFLKDKHKILLAGDYDVFGDHRVAVILSTPGHTQGHQSLKIVLPHQTVILSGDAYHTRQAYLHKLVPTFNYSRPETLSSMNRLESIMRDTHARLIIQHDPDDFASLPKIPQYLN